MIELYVLNELLLMQVKVINWQVRFHINFGSYIQITFIVNGLGHLKINASYVEIHAGRFIDLDESEAESEAKSL